MTSPQTSAKVRREWIPMAAQMKWANPGIAWEEVARQLNLDVTTIWRARQTEEWEIAFREAGNEYVEKLAPAAVHALVKQWAKGNASGAIDVLRAFGFLANERVNLDHTLTVSEKEIDDSIDRLLARLAAPGQAAPPSETLVVGANGKNGATTAHG